MKTRISSFDEFINESETLKEKKGFIVKDIPGWEFETTSFVDKHNWNGKCTWFTLICNPVKGQAKYQYIIPKFSKQEVITYGGRGLGPGASRAQEIGKTSAPVDLTLSQRTNLLNLLDNADAAEYASDLVYGDKFTPQEETSVWRKPIGTKVSEIKTALKRNYS